MTHTLNATGVELRTKFRVDDTALTLLHARAFEQAPDTVTPWADRLERHSVSWVGAFDGSALVGFVHACWDGGEHAFLLDTVVDPALQRSDLGRRLVQALAQEAQAAGCTWLHVDYQQHLRGFYLQDCGFRRTDAGLLRLAPTPSNPPS